MTKPNKNAKSHAPRIVVPRMVPGAQIKPTEPVRPPATVNGPSAPKSPLTTIKSSSSNTGSVETLASRPEDKFNYEIKAFVADGVVSVTSGRPHTRAEAEQVVLGIHRLGMVFLSADKLTATTYMPRHIFKLIITLTPVTGGSSEDK